MTAGERAIEQRARFAEAVETRREPRTYVERTRSIARRGDRLVCHRLCPIMIHDPAEQVAANEQELRKCEQIFDARIGRATALQSRDRRREIGDGDSAARIPAALDHEALLIPVSSAG